MENRVKNRVFGKTHKTSFDGCTPCAKKRQARAKAEELRQAQIKKAAEERVKKAVKDE